MSSRRSFLAGTASLALASTSLKPAAAQMRRLIVDAQIHMWPANRPDRPWVAGAQPQIPEPFTIERVVPMIDEAGVDRVVIVPPTLEGERIDYAQEAARRYPGRFGIMARIALDKADRAARLATWREQQGVLGVRLNITAEQGHWLTDGTTDWFWPAAEKAQIPIMFLTAGQSADFGRIAERHPQLTLIIDHMGVNSVMAKEKRIPAAIEQAVALAKYPNVSIKMSAAPNMSLESYPFRDVTEHLRRVFDAYGPQRCYWGTDLTNSFAKATYRQRVTHFTEELSFLSEDDKDWVMGRAILARLKWA
jgi:predicted TIM-barrel fold metal-dependent hydrolase